MSDIGIFTAKLYILIATFFFVIPLLLLCCCKCCCGKKKKIFEPEKDKEHFRFRQYTKLYGEDIKNLSKNLPASLKQSVIDTANKQISEDEATKSTTENISIEKLPLKKNNTTNIEFQEDVERADSSSNSSNKKMTYFTYKFTNMSEKESKKNPFKMLELFSGFMCKIAKQFDTSQVAILLYISSPGGIAYQFEKAYSQLKSVSKHGYKLIAVVDDICASGGYMLACACDEIIASPLAQIGSIGVISQTYNASGLATKIGVEEKIFKTGRYKGSFPTAHPYTEDDVAIMMEELNETFTSFKDIVTTSRGTRLSGNTNIFEAKVWYANTALEYGLIDRLCSYADFLEELTVSNNDIILVETKKSGFKLSISSLLKKVMTYIPSIATSIKSVFESRRSNVLLI